jgi:transposase
MLALTAHRRFFLYQHAADMRRGFDGLCGLVREGLRMDPLTGDVYIFLNRRRTQVKLLLWEHDGFSIYYKRLEEGTYEMPASRHVELRHDELMLILQGISLRSVRRRKRFEHAKNIFTAASSAA